MPNPTTPDTGFIEDSGAIAAALSQISSAALVNEATGLGTSSNRSKRARPTAARRLSRKERCDIIESSGIILRLITAYPSRAFRGWPEFRSSERSSGEYDEGPLQEYLSRLGLPEKFRDASMDARQHGDCYILLDIDDGRTIDQPVDMDRIRSIRAAEILFEHEVVPQTNCLNPEFYECSIHRADTKDMAERMGRGQFIAHTIHESRILRFTGIRLTGKNLELNQGRHLSCLQPVYDAFADYWQGTAASSEMLQSFNVFKYLLKGFSALSKRDSQEQILKRFNLLQMGMSVVDGLILDADNEDADFVSRSYSGVQPILEKLQEALVANSDTPWFVLMQSMNKGGLGSEGRSEAQRYQWAEMVQSWSQDNWEPNLMRLVRYIRAAADGPDIPTVKPYFNLTIELSPLEDAQRRQAIASAHEANIRAGIYTAYEARMSTHHGDKFSSNIQLDDRISQILEERTIEGLKSAPLPGQEAGQDDGQDDGEGDERDDGEDDGEGDSDGRGGGNRTLNQDDGGTLPPEQWERLATVSAQDFIAVAMGILES